MATAANLSQGAIPTNAAGDPFVGPAGGSLRYASFDDEAFSQHSSPAQARRALEAHLKDTDRRLQDASKLGSTLLQQRKELAARLEDIKLVQPDNELPDDLRKRLVELEKEYNEVGKESARAFLPRPRAAATAEPGDTPSVLSGQARESPTKVTAPSRRQRNQPSNRVHDIEFATEISTSLLAQVRQLQAALVEKDEALRETSSAKAQLEAEVASMVQRIKQMDEHEQRYKDEGWNLEMKIQELEGNLRETTDKHDRLNQSLKATQFEKAAAQRDLDELKVSHEKLAEDHATLKRHQEAETHSLRRDLTAHQSEKQALQRKIDELTSQNTELARALSSHWGQHNSTADRENIPPVEDLGDEDVSPEHSEPASPVKGTPRHGMLESETLKSSLTHAHRMIQNLKNNIHREKTEKIELKRMLQDAREELEARRSETGVAAANIAKKRSRDSDAIKFKKPARPERLGANRNSTMEILEDEPDWEDHEGEKTPSKPRFPSDVPVAAAAGKTAFDHAGFSGHDTETTDAFETANERDTTTETEAFETGNEELPGGDSDLTETESGTAGRQGTVRGSRVSSQLAGVKPRDRRSFVSTASTSADEDDEIQTPMHSQQPKYRLRMNRGARNSPRVGEIMAGSPSLHSPSSSIGTPQHARQTLGDELNAFDEESVGGTPSKSSLVEMDDVPSPSGTARQASIEPEVPNRMDVQAHPAAPLYDPDIGRPIVTQEHAQPESEQAEMAHQANSAMLAHEFTTKKAEMVDAGVMTDPWEPEKEIIVQKQSFSDRAGELVGGALAGFGLGRLSHTEHDGKEPAISGAVGNNPESVRLPQPVDEQDTMTGADAGLLSESEQRANSAAPADNSRPDSATVNNVPHAEVPTSIPPEAHKSLSDETRSIGFGSTVADQFMHSSILSQETVPIVPAAPMNEQGASPTTLPHTTDADAKPAVPLVAAIAPHDSQPAREELAFSFSGIHEQSFEPIAAVPEPLATPLTPITPLLPKRSSRRLDGWFGDDEALTETAYLENNKGLLPGTDNARPGSDFFFGNIPPPLERKRSKSVPSRQQTDRGITSSLLEPKVYGGVRKTDSGIPTLVFGDGDGDAEAHVPLSSVTVDKADLPPSISAESMLPVTKPLQIRKPMVDEGSQTMVTGTELDDMLRSKSRTSSITSIVTDPGLVGVKTAQAPQRRSIDGYAVGEAFPARGPRRPPSSSALRNKGAAGVPPPLPEDYTQKITAAQKQPAAAGPSTTGTMGPPLMPASAYRQTRPKTPADRAQERSLSRDGTTPRPVKPRDGKAAQVQTSARGSRRTSVSSFASELDERFNITRGDLIYPSDVAPSTDPRMIQAITQTMIGEYLWKYTRKAGRAETSSTRHRRFFWVHPYTRTLYWSEQDPSTAGRNMLKAKSMAITAVRVVTDDNTYPPGLHRKSIVVVTPGREIVFTAPTGQRHETWFNALSYLLLRTEQEKQEAEDTVNQDEVKELNPATFSSIRRSLSRLTGRDRSQDRASLSSYNSRTTSASSPQQREAATVLGGSLAQRQSSTITPRTPGMAASASTTQPERSESRTSTNRDSGSVNGRLSSLTTRFRPSSSQRGSSFSATRAGRRSTSLRGRPADPSEIYDASLAEDSAEDLRAVIERQEREADRLENVRACCDGKHDVGSLSRTGRHSSLSSRLGSQSHTHTSQSQSQHTHAHARAEPIAESARPRRGE